MKRPAFTSAQAQELATVDPVWGRLWRFLWETGCRRGEALALTGAQLEPRGDDTTLVRIIEHALPDGTAWRPKRPASVRAILVPSTVAPATMRMAYAFMPEIPRPVHAMRIKRALDAACDACGLPRAGTHAFRRGRIVQGLLAGAEPVQLSRTVGHASLKSTIAYVVHVPILGALPPSDAPPVANPSVGAYATSQRRANW